MFDYTWFRETNSPSMSKIDRILVSTDWEDHFLDVPKGFFLMWSNHYPLLVEVGDMSRGKSAFKFENTWLKFEGFVDSVRQRWTGYHFVRPPSYVLTCKLKALQGELKHWNKYVFGDVSFRKKCLHYELLDLNLREGLQVLTQEERARIMVIKAYIEYLASLEEIS